MTWYNRDERRFVEYGSSFMATLAEGTRQMVEDVLVNFNLAAPVALRRHRVRDARGRRPGHRRGQLLRLPRPGAPPDHPAVGAQLARRLGIVDAVYGPRRYFFGELFGPTTPARPATSAASVDRHGGHVGRWLVTRDGFDFLFLYFYETDAAQHRAGDVLGAVEQADTGLGLLVDAAGGWSAFLDRYAIMVVADHGQSSVMRAADAVSCRERSEAVSLEPALRPRRLRPGRGREQPGGDGIPAARRAADGAEVAHRYARHPGRRRGHVARGRLVRRAARGRRAAVPARRRSHIDERGNRWEVAGDADLLDPADYPNALERIEGALGAARTRAT